MSYFELPDEERPAEHIWLDPEAIEKHFKEVEMARKAKYAGNSEAVPEAGEEIENEAAAALLRR